MYEIFTIYHKLVMTYYNIFGEYPKLDSALQRDIIRTRKFTKPVIFNENETIIDVWKRYEYYIDYHKSDSQKLLKLLKDPYTNNIEILNPLENHIRDGCKGIHYRTYYWLVFIVEILMDSKYDIERNYPLKLYYDSHILDIIKNYNIFNEEEPQPGNSYEESIYNLKKHIDKHKNYIITNINSKKISSINILWLYVVELTKEELDSMIDNLILSKESKYKLSSMYWLYGVKGYNLDNDLDTDLNNVSNINKCAYKIGSEYRKYKYKMFNFDWDNDYDLNEVDDIYTYFEDKFEKITFNYVDNNSDFVNEIFNIETSYYLDKSNKNIIRVIINEFKKSRRYRKEITKKTFQCILGRVLFNNFDCVRYNFYDDMSDDSSDDSSGDTSNVIYDFDAFHSEIRKVKISWNYFSIEDNLDDWIDDDSITLETLNDFYNNLQDRELIRRTFTTISYHPFFSMEFGLTTTFVVGNGYLKDYLRKFSHIANIYQ